MQGSIKGRAVLFSEMTPPDGGDDAFNDWYDNHHTPSHVRGVPGFLSAMRYRSDAGPHYLAVYELSGADALNCDEYRSRKLTPDAATKRMLDSVSGFTRYIGEEVFARARGNDPLAALDAPLIHCAFFTVPLEWRGEFEDWFDGEQADALLACEDWLMVRRFEIVDWDPEPHTHMLLHYLADERALHSPELEAARQRSWWRKLAAEPWFMPHKVAYRRRGSRFLKAG
jgi:hypothetical protein